jgi:hypothetical protein
MVEVTYPAVVFGCNVKNDQEKYHVDESGYTRNRVDLSKEANKTRAM